MQVDIGSPPILKMETDFLNRLGLFFFIDLKLRIVFNPLAILFIAHACNSATNEAPKYAGQRNLNHQVITQNLKQSCIDLDKTHTTLTQGQSTNNVKLNLT
jgi:hypothetical protein